MRALTYPEAQLSQLMQLYFCGIHLLALFLLAIGMMARERSNMGR
jgi:hypothetical protein